MAVVVRQWNKMEEQYSSKSPGDSKYQHESVGTIKRVVCLPCQFFYCPN